MFAKFFRRSIWAAIANFFPLLGYAGPSPSQIHMECDVPGREYEVVDRLSDSDPLKKITCGGSKTGAFAFPTHALKFSVDSRAFAQKGGSSLSEITNGDTLYFNVPGAADDSLTHIRFHYALTSNFTLSSTSITTFMVGLPSAEAGVDYEKLGIAEPYNTGQLLQFWTVSCETGGGCAPLSAYPFERELTIYGRSAVVPVVIAVTTTASSVIVRNRKYSVEDNQVSALMSIELPPGVECYSKSGTLFSYKCPPVP